MIRWRVTKTKESRLRKVAFSLRKWLEKYDSQWTMILGDPESFILQKEGYFIKKIVRSGLTGAIDLKKNSINDYGAVLRPLLKTIILREFPMFPVSADTIFHEI
jgi:hypothetical protein